MHINSISIQLKLKHAFHHHLLRFRRAIHHFICSMAGCHKRCCSLLKQNAHTEISTVSMHMKDFRIESKIVVRFFPLFHFVSMLFLVWSFEFIDILGSTANLMKFEIHVLISKKSNGIKATQKDESGGRVGWDQFNEILWIQRANRSNQYSATS